MSIVRGERKIRMMMRAESNDFLIRRWMRLWIVMVGEDPQLIVTMRLVGIEIGGSIPLQ